MNVRFYLSYDIKITLKSHFCRKKRIILKLYTQLVVYRFYCMALFHSQMRLHMIKYISVYDVCFYLNDLLYHLGYHCLQKYSTQSLNLSPSACQTPALPTESKGTQILHYTSQVK